MQQNKQIPGKSCEAAFELEEEKYCMVGVGENERTVRRKDIYQVFRDHVNVGRESAMIV